MIPFKDEKSYIKTKRGQFSRCGRMTRRLSFADLQSMMRGVPEAGVVVINPSSCAIALRYGEEDEAPVVMALGRGALAHKINKAAVQSGVPLYQNVSLAAELLERCDKGEAIPAELYKEVAGAFAFANRKKRSREDIASK